MAFPLTHLIVADLILKKLPFEHSEFLLGSIAPDAVHYRAEFHGAAMANIGAAKKITHLCPVSDERWGQVTDNIGWEECVREFLRKNPNDAFLAGYAVHALTDIFNNTGIWNDFRTKYPEEAAKGYSSDYYKDMRTIDTQLYHQVYKSSGVDMKLNAAEARGIDGLVYAGEVAAIRESLVRQYDGVGDVINATYSFVSYDDVMGFIDGAAEYCVDFLQGIF